MRRQDEAGASGEQESGSGPRCSTERSKCVWSRCAWSKCARRSPHSSNYRKQIADLTAENNRMKVCAESSAANQDSVRVELYEALEQNYQLQGSARETPGCRRNSMRSCTSSFWRRRTQCSLLGSKRIPCWSTASKS